MNKDKKIKSEQKDQVEKVKTIKKSSYSKKKIIKICLKKKLLNLKKKVHIPKKRELKKMF